MSSGSSVWLSDGGGLTLSSPVDLVDTLVGLQREKPVDRCYHQPVSRSATLGRTRPGPRWLTDQLTECARAAVRTKETYLAAHFAQLRRRRGEPKAVGAIRHDLLVA